MSYVFGILSKNNQSKKWLISPLLNAVHCSSAIVQYPNIARTSLSLVLSAKMQWNLHTAFKLPYAGASLGISISGCQYPVFYMKRWSSWWFLSLLVLNRRVPKYMFKKSTGVMAPVAPVLTTPLSLVSEFCSFLRKSSLYLSRSNGLMF